MSGPARENWAKCLVAVFIGISQLYIDMAVAQSDASQTNVPPAGGDLWVEVEPTNILPSDLTGIYYLVPYRNRREKWGQTVSVGYSSFAPMNYEPNFITADFSDIYSGADMPLIELQYSFKRNFLLGSIGMEIGGGMYQNSSDSDLIESDLELIPVRVGINLYLDNLWFEPYVVPYAAGGIYTIFYNESTSATSFGGNTEIAPYFVVGLQMQLNWADREAARISYTDSGIENTFLYFEGRQFMASQAARDPDFSTGFDWGAGMRLEF